jgi:hypothetical protein
MNHEIGVNRDLLALRPTGFIIASANIVAKFRVPLPRPFGLPD